MASSTSDEDSSEEVKVFKFPSHKSHTLTLAKMVKESKAFADCVIQCDDGVQLRAHRLVLGAASEFLKEVFREVPSSLSEATVVVPGVKEPIVSGLIDFLYTGEMKVERRDTADLQRLIEALQIDRNLIDVQAEQQGEEQQEQQQEQGEEQQQQDEEGEERKRKRKLSSSSAASTSEGTQSSEIIKGQEANDAKKAKSSINTCTNATPAKEDDDTQ